MGDASYCGKTQARAAIGGGKERVEDSHEILLAYPTTIVGDFNQRLISRFFVASVFSTPDGHRHLTVDFDGLDGIDNEIQHRVFDLRRVGGEDNVILWRLKFNAQSRCALSRSVALERGQPLFASAPSVRYVSA